MARGPVDRKNIEIEQTYGYLNIHLELLHKAIKNNDKQEIIKQKIALKEIKNKLLKLRFWKGK